MTIENIQFIQNRQPALGSGDFLLEVTLANPAAPADRQPCIQRQFTVAGERFALKPADIQAVFPPAGSLGDHSNVLPHISLNRSTLPWERQAVAGSSEVPWLALLLFEEQEAPSSTVVSLVPNIKEPYKDFTLETGQKADDQVTVIDVPRTTLEKILPTPQELQFLAHVRRGVDQQECAVVIGSRLPKQGGTSVVHLVSLEGCYAKDQIFNYPASDPVRLISLYSWRFACADKDQSFSGLLKHLNCGTLRLSKRTNQNANAYLALGCALLPHKLQGDPQKLVYSWYHGPLLPGRNTTTEADLPLLPARRPEDLRIFDAFLGMLDVSYAAAWELGRFLALQSTNFSVELFHWKRAQRWKIQEAARQLTHLSPGAPAHALTLPPSVLAWFERLEHLEGIPFNYLVPDEGMLRPESLRFFKLDWFWLECLQDGALSIGRLSKDDQARDADIRKLLDNALDTRHWSQSTTQVTGFLLRSDVVAGWPGLLVDGYGQKGAIPLLLMKRLAKDILICLFAKDLARFEVYLKAETMNFGVNGSDTSDFAKKFRDKDGKSADESVSIPWRKEANDTRVIDIAELTKTMKETTGMDVNSAQFAYQMIEGAAKVTFQLS